MLYRKSLRIPDIEQWAPWDPRKEKERGALITTEVEQVIKLAPCKIIGVTGSKGKTTTTTIINNILNGLGYHTYLGGNIGTPLYAKLNEMTRNDIIVLELSSFQLMNMTVSPNIAVVTNISPDHLDIHGSYEEYINAKKQIFLNQTKDDVLVLNKEAIIDIPSRTFLFAFIALILLLLNLSI